MRPAAFAAPGRWYRGNLHAHSDRSDGVAPPEEVIAAYWRLTVTAPDGTRAWTNPVWPD
jgi:hypothetical protein